MIRQRMLSLMLLIALLLGLAVPLSFPARAYTVSDWTPRSSVPSGAEVLERKWVYQKTTYINSRETSMPGYSLAGTSWVENGSGWTNYAAFPGGFQTSHEIYTSFTKSDSCPYANGEGETWKRTVSDNWGGYVYWHWMYDTNRANGTPYRAIYHKYGYGPDNSYLYKYFGAFTSTRATTAMTSITATARASRITSSRSAPAGTSARARRAGSALSTGPPAIRTTISCSATTKPRPWNPTSNSANPAPMTLSSATSSNM